MKLNTTKINRDSYNRIAHMYAQKYMDGTIQKYIDGSLITNIKRGKVLDLGCGPGNNFEYLLSMKPSRITAVDFSEKMLQEAKLRHPKEKIKYLKKSFQELELKIKYDFIVANLALVNLNTEDLEKVLVKIRSWLSKKGVFFANYFEGDDEYKELKSDWGNKNIVRYFGMIKETTLRNLYRKAKLKILKIERIDIGKSFVRINVTAGVE